MPAWPWTRKRRETADDDHLALAQESLRELVRDERLPAGVRESLAGDYAAVEAMLDKLEHGHLHLAVFGRVSTGKSSLLNALVGEPLFSVSPLHGETRAAEIREWREVDSGGVFLIDTPGIDEAGGEERERLARDVAGRSDLVMFVVDADLTANELQALQLLMQQGRPVIVVLNKADLYSDDDRRQLLASLARRTEGLIDPRNIVAVAAEPRPETVIEIDANGDETERRRPREVDVEALRLRLWDTLENEGKTLAALNASLFAAELSDQVGRRILDARRQLGERVVRTYCLAKGVAVALNPLPVADLFAAAVMDVGMVVHLSRVYGLPLGRREAGSLVRVIVAESMALMGTVWAMHFVSSALKVGTAGASTLITAAAQGAVAWYSTYVVGRIASEYLANGKSWGSGGPRAVVQRILDNLDRDTILKDAKREIRTRMRLG